MDAFVDIAGRLGVDYTIFIQLLIFTGLYFALKNILFDKLLEVLQFREDKTDKLLKKAEEKQSKTEEMTKEYQEKINAVYATVQKDRERQEEEMGEQQRIVWQKEEDVLNEQMEKQMEQLKSLMKKNREEVKKEVAPLAQKLLDKLAS